MLNIPLKDVIAKIAEKSALSEQDIRKKVSEKVESLHGLVSEEGAAHIIANEYGIKLFEVLGELKIKDVLIGMKSVDVTGKVVRKYELREFHTEKRSGKVANLLMADETSSIRLVFWGDKTDDFTQLKEGDVIKIRNAYVKDNAGRKELHMGDSSSMIINPAGITVNARERKEYDRKHISELVEGMNAEIMGTIVQVFDIRFFEVCPKCNKRLRLSNEQFQCDMHGVQIPAYNYILNIFLDDGTGNVRVNFWKQQAQKLLGMKDEDVQVFRSQQENFEDTKNRLLGEQIKVMGLAKKTIMDRLEFTAELVFTNLNPEEEITMLDNAKEVVLNAEKKSDKPKMEYSEDEFEVSEDFLED